MNSVVIINLNNFIVNRNQSIKTTIKFHLLFLSSLILILSSVRMVIRTNPLLVRMY